MRLYRGIFNERQVQAVCDKTVYHLEGTFDWGRMGPGATALSEAMLADYLGGAPNQALTQEFQRNVIASLKDDFDITDEEIDAALSAIHAFWDRNNLARHIGVVRDGDLVPLIDIMPDRLSTEKRTAVLNVSQIGSRLDAEFHVSLARLEPKLRTWVESCTGADKPMLLALIETLPPDKDAIEVVKRTSRSARWETHSSRELALYIALVDPEIVRAEVKSLRERADKMEKAVATLNSIRQ